MTIIIKINAKKLSAVALLAAKQDIRYYLCGVYVEATAAETRLAATNGHYAGLLRHANMEPNEGVDWQTLIIPNEIVERVVAANKKIPRGFEPHCNVVIDGGYSMHLWDQTVIPFKPLEGTFPDIRRITPVGKRSEIATAFDVDYMALFAKVNKALGAKHPTYINMGFNGPGEKIAITFGDEQRDFIGILMPIRSYACVIKPWPHIGADAVEPAAEEVTS